MTDWWNTDSERRLHSGSVTAGIRDTEKIPLFPLSFGEFYPYVGGDERKALDTYMLYGGMPGLLTLSDEKDKN